MPNSNNSLSTYTSMMRVTSAGRPFAKDLFDIFGAFLIQTPLKDHRSLFRTYPNSITTDEAVSTFADLKFVHVMRTPDPNDPNTQITTRTTTTFSMTREMAKTLGQHILNSRLAENAADPQNRTMKDRATWYVTPKGKYMVQDFSQRAGVNIAHIQKSLDRIDSFRIVKFDRLIDTDSLSFARPNMTTAFKTMMAWLPTETLLADDVGGLKDKQAHEYTYTFYGYQCFEWISEYTTVVSAEEALMIASEFVLYGWLVQILDKSDKSNSTRSNSNSFKTSKRAIYHVTERGRKILGWQTKSKTPPEGSLSKQASINCSSAAQSEALKKQRALARRLVPTGLQSSSSSAGIPSATITCPKSNNPLCNKMGFPVPKEGSSKSVTSLPESKEESGIDEMTEQLLHLRCTGESLSSGSDRPPSITSSAGSSNDSSFELSLGVAESPAPSILEKPMAPGHIDVLTVVEASDIPLSDCASGSSGNVPRDSQWTRLRQILEDPLLRMYFRDFMKANFCEENINFWVDYYSLRKKARSRRMIINELLTDCYTIYDTYLGMQAISEVNIDHGLRQEIISLVTTTFKVAPGSSLDMPFLNIPIQPTLINVTVNGSSQQCLQMIMRMYDKVNDHICRLMAQDSVPRFVKSEKYRQFISQNNGSA
ncbi:hypothetical protein CLU79DRAFT_837606 [Phycomyces nitens]|nr:hypothetical protein CLU79DRAFT_837606 [Phycomyces nitens]